MVYGLERDVKSEQAKTKAANDQFKHIQIQWLGEKEDLLKQYSSATLKITQAKVQNLVVQT